MKKRVYLAGPITGLTYDGAQDWRSTVSKALDSNQVECLTPMRGKSFLKQEGTIHSGSWDHITCTSKGITRRDMFDTVNATCLFVNLLGAERVSIGTVMELAWSYLKQIPTIVVMEEGNIHGKHVMVQESCTYTVRTVEEGLYLTRYLLNEVSE
jgi:nucleoside 2-deoxyribosyltransferase